MTKNKKNATREEMIAILNKRYPSLMTKTTEEFHKNDSPGRGIWSGSCDIIASDKFKLIDYYATNRTVAKRYEFGVHIHLRKLLEKNGWYPEWWDCGTLMFYPIKH